MGSYYEEHETMSGVVGVFSEVVGNALDELSSVLSDHQRRSLRKDLGCCDNESPDIFLAQKFSEQPEVYSQKWFRWQRKFDKISLAKDRLRERISGVVSAFKQEIAQIEGEE